MGIIVVIAFLAVICLSPLFGADSRRYDERGGLRLFSHRQHRQQ